MKRAALISVSNRDGLVEFAKGLREHGLDLLCTSGTGKYLQESGIDTVSIEDYTGQKEILDGRVKTLHPRIHAGLLARKDDPNHIAQLEEDDIYSIEVAAVNLYPFTSKMESDVATDPLKMIEFVDIGGPTMVRAAAKNFKGIYAVIDPADYPEVLSTIAGANEKEGLKLRHRLATRVFAELANYNLQIARYFSNVDCEDGELTPDTSNSFHMGEYEGVVLKRKQSLRYGENPAQSASFYSAIDKTDQSWQQLQGKELSYNNLLDFDAAFRMIPALPADTPAAVLVKHLNPCGAAFGKTLAQALQKAKECDPRSHFGGIIALNQCVDAEAAKEMTKDFCEIILAPEYTEEALQVLQAKKNVRVLKVDPQHATTTELRSIQSGVLLQTSDRGASAVQEAELVTSRKLSDEEGQDLQLAWNFCAHVKSNAITLAKDGRLISCGAGQMSRIDSLEVALLKCRTHNHDIRGAVAASDAFFPFYDCIEELAKNGVVAVIAPCGANRDEEVKAKAEELGISLLFVQDRHFRH